MKFCKMCGSPLESPKGQPAKISCPSCGGDTPTGYKFCQHCGTPLGATPPPQTEASPPQPSPSPVATGVVPKTVVPTAAPGFRTPAPGPVDADSSMAKTIIDMDEAGGGSPERPELRPPEPVQPEVVATPHQAAVSGAIQTGTPAGGMPVTPESGQEEVKATLGPGAKRVTGEDVVQHARDPLARLVSVNRDGSDGEVHSIVEESVDLGRSQGQLRFQDDPYLSDRHCRFSIKNGEWIVQDMGSTNGVYIRISAPRELQDGDQLLLGKQVLRFELLSDEERDLTPAVEHGVLIFGSPLRVPWCRIRQVTVAGVARDVYHLCRSKVTVGREDGDLVFPDDEFMSRRHLVLSQDGSTARVEDVGSSNGTYVRIRKAQRLSTGAMIRIGDQLLRFEKA